MTILRKVYVRFLLVLALTLQTFVPGQSTFAYSSSRQVEMANAIHVSQDAIQNSQMIHGQVMGNGELLLDSLLVYALDLSGMIVQVVPVDSNGWFSFPPMPVSHYQLRLANQMGEILPLTPDSEVNIAPEQNRTEIHLKLALPDQKDEEPELVDPLPALLQWQQEQETARESLMASDLIESVEVTETAPIPAGSSEIITESELNSPQEVPGNETVTGNGSILLPEAQLSEAVIYLPLIAQDSNNSTEQFQQSSVEATSSEDSAVMEEDTLVDDSIYENAAGAGVITGQVTDLVSGNGISSVSVTAREIDGIDSGFASTNASGFYTIPALMAGTYRVQFQPLFNSDYLSEYYNNKRSTNDADPINVVDDQTTPNINAGLETGGTIIGRVTNSSGSSPISNVSVQLYNASDVFVDSESTNSGGYYTFTKLLQGSYKVRFVPSGNEYIEEYYNNKSTKDSADSINVTFGETKNNVNGTLDKGGMITGRVTDKATSAGIEDINVTAQENSSFISRSANTDASGYYTITGLVAGSYRVQFRSFSNPDYLEEYYNDKRISSEANLVQVSLNATASNINAALEKGGKITGRVTDSVSGDGITDVFVRASGLDTNDSGSSSTDDSGYYTITSLLADDYRVFFDAPFNSDYLDEYYNDKRNQSDATPVSVALDSTTPNINAALDTGGKIKGRVTNSSGAGIENVYVNAGSIATNDSGSDYSDANGNFEIKALAPAAYRVSFDPPPNTEYLEEYYNNQRSFTTAAPVTVTLNSTVSNINAQLETGGRITGRVTNSSGAGVKDVNVSVSALSVNAYGSTYSDAAGYYTITSLIADRYQVNFTPPGNTEYVKEYYNNSHSASTATPVTVTLNSTTPNINAQLEPQGKITGRVTNSNGTGVEDVYIRVNSTTSSDYEDTYSDSAGYYTVTQLSAGSYHVKFTPYFATDYVEEYYNNQRNSGSATVVTVNFGATTPNIHATLETGGKITGRITDSNGAPVSGVSVSADAVSANSDRSTSTDAGGYYTLTHLLADNYRVYFNPQSFSNNDLVAEYYNNQRNQFDSDLVAVSLNTTTANINAQLETGGKITGRVTNSSGAAMSGVYVYVDAVSSSNSANTYTDAGGYYTITRLYADDYTVQFTPPNGSLYVGEYYNNQHLSQGNRVTVAFNSTQLGINAQLELGGQIKGQVTNPAGGAMADVTVEASQSTSFFSSESATTDGSGNYTITGLITDTYYVRFSPSDGEHVAEYYNNQRLSGSADEVNIELGKVRSGIDAKLEKGGKISGLVTNASGAAFANVTVEAYGSPDAIGWFNRTSTDANGNYTVTPLYTGLYYLKFVPPGSVYLQEYYDNQPELVTSKPVTALLNTTTSGINAQLAVGGQVTGRVTNAANEPLEDVDVYAYSSLLDTTIDASASTDASGYYTLTPLLPGTNYIRFVPSSNSDYAKEYYNGKKTRSSANPVNVTVSQIIGADEANSEQNTVTGINAILEENAGSIRGRITNKSGAGVEGVDVYAYLSPVENFSNAYARSDASGNYTLTALAPGNYYLRFRPSGNQYLEEYYNNQLTQAAADPVAVTANTATSNMNVELATRNSGAVTGQVTRSDGKPVQGAYISFYDSPVESNAVHFAQADASGRYTATNLLAGSYYVRFDLPFSVENQNYLEEYYNNKRNFADATPITVTTNVTLTNINTVLDLGGVIKGRVTDSKGAGVKDARVSVAKTPINYALASATTDATGAYTITGLPAGGYYAEFSAPFGSQLLDEFYNNQRIAKNGVPVTVTLGNTLSAIDAVLEQGGAIKGIVTGADTSKPLAGSNVFAYGLNECDQQQFMGGAVTDVSGSYTLTQLPTGSYEVLFYPSGQLSGSYLSQVYNNKSTTPGDKVMVTAGNTTTAINAALQRGGQITGRVTASDNGLPLADVRVYFYREDGGEFKGYDSTITNAEGFYTSDSLLAGNFKLEFFPTNSGMAEAYLGEYHNDKSTLTTANAINVTQGSVVNNINAALARGGQIAGTVVDEVTLRPISGVDVYVYTGTSNSASIAARGETNSAGVYLTSGLPQGNYFVEFDAPSFNSIAGDYIDEYYNNKNNLIEASPVAVSGSNITAHIDAGLKLGGEIHGWVAGSDGRALSGVQVTATGNNGSQSYDFSNFDGSYSITGLPSDTYRVTFKGGSQSLRCGSLTYGTVYYNQRTRFEDADPLTLVVPNRSHEGIQGASVDDINAVPSIIYEINGVLPLGQSDTPTPVSTPNPGGEKVYLPVVQR